MHETNWHQNWILEHFNFLFPHLIVRTQTRHLGSVRYYIFYLLVFINIYSLINVLACIVIFYQLLTFIVIYSTDPVWSRSPAVIVSDEEDGPSSSQSTTKPNSQPTTKPSSQSTNQSTRQSTVTSPGTSGLAPKKKGKKKGTDVIDKAMTTIAGKIKGSDRLERRVEQLMEVETNPRTAWAHWMGQS